MSLDRWPELTRYAAVSVAALAVDFAAMHLLMDKGGWPLLPACATGFALGMVVAYLLSCRWAFRDHGHAPNWHGWLVFSAIGMGGLVLNSALVWLSTAALGLAWPVAKLLAAGGSFSFNFVMRRLALFMPDLRNPGRLR